MIINSSSAGCHLLKPGDLMKPCIILAVQVRLSWENMAARGPAPPSPLV